MVFIILIMSISRFVLTNLYIYNLASSKMDFGVLSEERTRDIRRHQSGPHPMHMERYQWTTCPVTLLAYLSFT